MPNNNLGTNDGNKLKKQKRGKAITVRPYETKGEWEREQEKIKKEEHSKKKSSTTPLPTLDMTKIKKGTNDSPPEDKSNTPSTSSPYRFGK